MWCRAARVFLTVALLFGALSCGRGGPGLPEACPSGPAGGSGLRGVVLEGRGSDGELSGLPVSCALVVLEDRSGIVTAFTDPAGRFSAGRGPSGQYAVHVTPPRGSDASSLSVYGLDVGRTGLELVILLPVRRPLGRARDPALGQAVAGTLVSVSGFGQPGFSPPGQAVGGPGTLGFVWWGAAGRLDSGRWVDSGVTDDSGNFHIWTDTVSRYGTSRPLFSGNYGGRAATGDVFFYTEYAVLPAVSARGQGFEELGQVRMRPVDSLALLDYDTRARDVLRFLGRSGLSLAVVLASPASPGEELELARAVTGPAVGQLAVRQQVPVPDLWASPAFRGLWVLGYAYDASVRDGTGEVSVVRAPLSARHATVSYLRAPGPPQRDPEGFSWMATETAAVYEVSVRDRASRPLWVGVVPGTQTSARLPSGLPEGAYLAYVSARDWGGTEEWVLGGPQVPGAVAARAGLPAVRRSAVPTRTLREAFSRTVFLSP